MNDELALTQPLSNEERKKINALLKDPNIGFCSMVNQVGPLRYGTQLKFEMKDEYVDLSIPFYKLLDELHDNDTVYSNKFSDAPSLINYKAILLVFKEPISKESPLIWLDAFFKGTSLKKNA